MFLFMNDSTLHKLHTPFKPTVSGHNYYCHRNSYVTPELIQLFATKNSATSRRLQETADKYSLIIKTLTTPDITPNVRLRSVSKLRPRSVRGNFGTPHHQIRSGLRRGFDWTLVTE